MALFPLSAVKIRSPSFIFATLHFALYEYVPLLDEYVLTPAPIYSPELKPTPFFTAASFDKTTLFVPSARISSALSSTACVVISVVVSTDKSAVKEIIDIFELLPE